MPKKQKEVKKNPKKMQKKKNPFNFKEWIKLVLEKSSNKRNKIPKISATFKLIVVEVEKNKGKQAEDVLKKMGSKLNMVLFGRKDTSKELKLLAIKENEIELILSLFPCEGVQDDLCENICNSLKNKGFDFATAYAIKPSSADLNLIYLLRKGD